MSEESSVPPSDLPSYEQATPLHYRDSIMTYDSDIRSVYRDQYQTTRVSNHSAIRRSHRGLDIASIDDMGLSDLSSDAHEMSPPPGPGLKKPMRKLPTRRDVEFMRQSMSSLSSMGIRTRESMLSQESSVVSSSSEVDAENDEAAAVQGPLQAWQISAIHDSLSDDGESGDAEVLKRHSAGLRVRSTSIR